MKPRIPQILTVLTALLTALGTAYAGEGAHPVYSEAEVDQLLAPIALYPDALLSQVLMAATYPLEVVHAARWSREHPELEGEAAVEAVAGFDWDESVKALVAFPELIQLMDENLGWMHDLGEAFLADEALVLEAVQDLRRHALENGGLKDFEHVRVEKEVETILIEPADVRVVRVPYYTRVVYGDWWWPDYPPYFWDPPFHDVSIGFYWSRGFHVSSHFYYSTCHWPRRKVVIVDRPHRPDRIHVDRRKPIHRYDRYLRDWRHDPLHRRGVRYQTDYLRDRYRKERFLRPDRRPVPPPPPGRVDRPDRRRPDGHYSVRPDDRRRPPVATRPDRDRGDRPPATTRPDRGRPERHIDRGDRPQRPPTAMRPDRKPPTRVTPPPPAPPPPPDIAPNPGSRRDSGSSYRSSRRDSGGYASRSSGNNRRAPIRRNDP